MLHIEFHPDAAEELIQSKRWYDLQSEAIGQRYFMEVERAIEIISQNPKRWPVSEKGISRFYLRRFPYKIVYHINGDHIRIIAMMHQRRKPGYWKKRT